MSMCSGSGGSVGGGVHWGSLSTLDIWTFLRGTLSEIIMDTWTGKWPRKLGDDMKSGDQTGAGIARSVECFVFA